jgi:hypothetical protein
MDDTVDVAVCAGATGKSPTLGMTVRGGSMVVVSPARPLDQDGSPPPLES